MKISKLTQAAIEGIISTSKTFQDVKDRCRALIATTSSMVRTIAMVADVTYQHAVVIEQHDKEIDNLNKTVNALLSRYSDGALETSLPPITKRQKTEEKPN